MFCRKKAIPCHIWAENSGLEEVGVRVGVGDGNREGDGDSEAVVLLVGPPDANDKCPVCSTAINKIRK